MKRKDNEDDNTQKKKCKKEMISRVEMLERLINVRQDIVAQVDVFGTQQLYNSSMSLKTKDEITAAAMLRLHQLENGLTISSIRKLTISELDQLLIPVGFHKKKAHQILTIAKTLEESYDNDIPQTTLELYQQMQLPGIGPKVARLIMLVAWKKADGIIVDTHVHRISHRLGWTSKEAAKFAEASRRELEEWVPRQHWPQFSQALIGFGQSYCSSLHPKCSLCPLSDHCPYFCNT
ncbi:endonuclease III, HhH-GPD superfamily base excision DNA repair [Thraustotheca clavata]|uniref:Endonuclease III, HhH-GPD superfamily base excision DNA repair n=1 Tax=Thraustotheca clavata TaxID=74557 RepID=A0A1V9Z2R4_9STRA|nr:endonuclease III, HhH-GPD superfamily base excision DNA repair [Thraustotheca clavata]